MTRAIEIPSPRPYGWVFTPELPACLPPLPLTPLVLYCYTNRPRRVTPAPNPSPFKALPVFGRCVQNCLECTWWKWRTQRKSPETKRFMSVVPLEPVRHSHWLTQLWPSPPLAHTLLQQRGLHYRERIEGEI